MGTISGMAAFATAVNPLNRPMPSLMASAMAKVGEKPKAMLKTTQLQSPILITTLRPTRSLNAPQ